jgi:hypothetical protein
LPQHIRPLLYFPNIEMFFVSFFQDFTLDDNFMKELAISWPRIHLLRLYMELPGVPTPPTITLKGLQFLAMHCNQLRHLTVRLNACLLPEDTTPPMVFSNSALEELPLFKSPIEDELAVADLLGHMFPRLKRSRRLAGMTQEEKRRWGKVMEILNAEDAGG